MVRFTIKIYLSIFFLILIHPVDPVGQTNYQVVLALTYIIVLTGKSSDISETIVSSLDKSQIKDWANCLDRRQV